MRHALEVAGNALTGVATLANGFHDVQFSARSDTLDHHKDSATHRALVERGVYPGSQAPDPDSKVPHLHEAYWRDQVSTRPALPARTRVWLPTEIHARSALNSPTPREGSVRLGYNYFHGNLVGGGLFIATQSPPVKTRRTKGFIEPLTFDARADFWIVVRAKNVRAVVMLADWEEGDREDLVVPYLPLVTGGTLTFYAYEYGLPPTTRHGKRGAVGEGGGGGSADVGDWRVRVSVTTIAATTYENRDIIAREVQVRYAIRRRTANGMVEVIEDDSPHTLHHYHYRRWPDGGIPDDPSDVLALTTIAGAALLRNTTDNPTMVHCLAGHGRTGTLLTAVMALRLHAPNQRVTLSEHLMNVFAGLRNERYYLVSSQIQLLFAYTCFVLLLRALQEQNPGTAVITDVKKIQQRLSGARPRAEVVCVNCMSEIPRRVSAVRVPLCGTLTNFCTATCADSFLVNNGAVYALYVAP